MVSFAAGMPGRQIQPEEEFRPGCPFSRRTHWRSMAKIASRHIGKICPAALQNIQRESLPAS